MSARKEEIITEFVDQYGDKRIVHRGKRGVISIKNRQSTVVHQLNRVAAVETGRRIRSRREAAGMTLEELCGRSGLVANASPKARMWEIENCIRQQGMRLGTIYAIALALCVPVHELLPSADEVANLAGVKTVSLSPALRVVGQKK